MKLIYLILLVFSFNLFAADGFDKDQFLSEWSSPINSDEARSTIYTGSAITTAIILGRNSGFDQFQEDMAEDQPRNAVANLDAEHEKWWCNDHTFHDRKIIMT